MMIMDKHRPRLLEGVTIKVETPFKDVFVTVNDLEGEPFEVFVNASKAGSDIAADAEGLGRMISLLLRSDMEKEPLLRLRQVYEQLRYIGGARSTGFGPNRIRSVPDAVAYALGVYAGIKGISFSEESVEPSHEVEINDTQASAILDAQ